MAVKKQLIDATRLDNVSFLDFETTGLRDPMPVSLALIHAHNNTIDYAKYFLINPDKEIEYGAFQVHKISQKMVQDKPNFATVWEEIKPYISGGILVGHNIKFDSGVIQNCIQKYNLDCDTYQTICTCENAKRFITKENINNYKLDTVCNYFNIDFGTHHSAQDDTASCLQIFNRLRTMGKLEAKTIEMKQEELI